MKYDRCLRTGMALGLLSATGLGAALAPAPAAAFCGFYVAGADTQLYANATMVVLMREGTKTVLSMQNNYQGPPQDFAMVVPVPTVLNEDQVKILPHEVFEHVDTLGAPRLVEYWEQDPCLPIAFPEAAQRGGIVLDGAAPPSDESADLGVTIEAQFTVGEYEVVILSAEDSSGLDTWLRANDYNIPEGAEPVLAPYVASGTKFFVAKVDPEKVTFKDGQAVLSPLRFHYDSEDFSLPVRLGLLNSQGTQDLIVNILATDRYELANYPNVTIPTNLRVHNEVRDVFGGFYESLFTEVLEKKPGAVVTEYSWAASTCDPCPTEPLSPQDLQTLGQDVIQPVSDDVQDLPVRGRPFFDVTLTRLHYRYNSEGLDEDLVFKAAEPIIGGRGTPDQKGKLPSTEPSPSNFNNFQGRYVILHPWEDKITCDAPQRGLWGGPPGQGQPQPRAAGNQALSGAAPEAAKLPQLVAEAIPELDVKPWLALNPLDVRTGDLPSGDEDGDGDPNAPNDIGDEETDGGATADNSQTQNTGENAAGNGTGNGTTGNDAGGSDTSGSAGEMTSGTKTDDQAATTSDAAQELAAGSADDGAGCSCRVGGAHAPAPLTTLGLLAGLTALWTRRRRR